MIDFLLLWFGYVKIPKAAIHLSYTNQEILKKILGEDNIYYHGQKTLTEFLRSGRI